MRSNVTAGSRSASGACGEGDRKGGLQQVPILHSLPLQSLWRRAALSWIREHGSDQGVVYFADDDNSYDTRIFEEIRKTQWVVTWETISSGFHLKYITSTFMFLYNHSRGVSVFPVGLVLKYGVSSPILRDGRVTGFYDAFQAGRKVTDFSANLFNRCLVLLCTCIARINTYICKISYTLKWHKQCSFYYIFWKCRKVLPTKVLKCEKFSLLNPISNIDSAGQNCSCRSNEFLFHIKIEIHNLICQIKFLLQFVCFLS